MEAYDSLIFQTMYTLFFARQIIHVTMIGRKSIDYVKMKQKIDFYALVFLIEV